MRNSRFGELLSEGIASVARKRGLKKFAVEEEIAHIFQYSHYTVQHWQRGYAPKNLEHIRDLVRYCVTRGRVDRAWAANLLSSVPLAQSEAFLRELFPEPVKVSTVRRLYHNLPPRHGTFLGRQEETNKVLKVLGSRWPVVAIEGLGGVGKTTLAIEAAYRCLTGPDTVLDNPFTAIVWISAKDGSAQSQWLDEVLNYVAGVLDYPHLQQLSLKEKITEIDQLLRAYRTLVIIDNFETIQDLSLIDWIIKVPEPSKVLITTRYSTLRSVWDIRLAGLGEADALELIRIHVDRLGLKRLGSVSDQDLLPLYAVTEGNPEAIVLSLGHTKYSGLTFAEVVKGLHSASQSVNDIFDYLFARAWEILSEDARKLLLATSLLKTSTTKETLGVITGLIGYRLDQALSQLVEVSLLEAGRKGDLTTQSYDLHPLTRAFALAQLIIAPELEKEFRARGDGSVEWIKSLPVESLSVKRENPRSLLPSERGSPAVKRKRKD